MTPRRPAKNHEQLQEIAETRRREGRGPLSSIELLPDEAQVHVLWVRDELLKRKRKQIDILDEFNRRLAKLGHGPISLSAFNRYSVRKAVLQRHNEEWTAIARGLGERRKPSDIDDLTLLAGESIKTLGMELLEKAHKKNFTSKHMMEFGRALAAVSQAEHVSAKRLKQMQAEFDKKASKAIDVVAKQKGLTPATVKAIKDKVLFGKGV